MPYPPPHGPGQGGPYPQGNGQGAPYPQGGGHPQGPGQGGPHPHGSGQGGPYPPGNGRPRQGPPPHPGPGHRPPHGPAQGPYGPWQRPPQRRKSNAGAIVGAVFGSLAAIFVLLVIGSAVFKGASDTDTTSPIAIPTYTPPTFEPRDDDTDESAEPTDRPSDQPSSSDQPSDRPSDQPSDQPSSDRPSSSEQPSSEPPTSEQPTSEQPTSEQPATVKLNTSLQANTLYFAGGLPRTTCRAGSASLFSHSQLKALILKTGKCMDAAWAPILRKKGIDWSPPNYAIAAKRGRGACGDYPSPGSMVPYYCPRNNTIYASTSALARGNGNSIGYGEMVAWHGATISMMAHEYGHHIQQITGILDSHWQKHVQTSSQSGRLALSRKLELQATCFGGMFMRAVADTYPVSGHQRDILFWFYSKVGDHPGYPRDHGTPANNNVWFRQGWLKNKAYQCNTWLAPASTTS
ncbi:neutral zinc metallopeptidase [Nonomuraea sp. NPDC003727]